MPLPAKPPPPPLPLLVVLPAPFAPAELVEIVEPIEDDAVGKAVVPGREVPAVAVAPELPIAGRATAPPEAGKPLRCAALPTAPLVGVAEGAAVWAAAAAAKAVENRKASAAKRIVTR